MVYGKIPPQSKELEQAVLGAVLIEKNAFDKAAEILTPECFYLDVHQRVFRACSDLKNRNSVIDMLTVIEQLQRNEDLDMCGGPTAIVELTKNVVSSAHLEHHAKIILQKYLQRELIRMSGEIITSAYEDSTDVFDLLQEAENKLSRISLHGNKKEYSSLHGVVEKLLTKVQDYMQRPDTVTGVPTGIGMLDYVTAGWQPGDLIIIAARPSIGKSAIAGNLAKNAALHPERPCPVGIFSLEMPDMQWAMRLLSAEAYIDSWKINRGKISEQEFARLVEINNQRFVNAKIFIDDTAGMDIYEFKSKARKMVHRDRVKMILVDYLQLMSGRQDRNSNREQEISTISRNLKSLAKELNIPIIALSQLSRGVEKNGRNQPKLSDLRESGAIEQDADVVIFLVPVEDDQVIADATLRDSISLKIAKHRNGALETVEVKFAKDIQKIMSRSDYDHYEKWKFSQSIGGSFVPVPQDDSDDLPF